MLPEKIKSINHPLSPRHARHRARLILWHSPLLVRQCRRDHFPVNNHGFLLSPGVPDQYHGGSTGMYADGQADGSECISEAVGRLESRILGAADHGFDGHQRSHAQGDEQETAADAAERQIREATTVATEF